ncbi:hypothetical protein [Tissierella pigra]|uniref:YqbQ/XkdQ domain-containing protein n=1 Tax=Tissierella pigra TaxID=2607614 RepID=A0A6N7Y589_9FIRM|nr:hypothetical protein [Tissierella pigra]MSU03210.1 hypothetical protein [Tissierella pigra]
MDNYIITLIKNNGGSSDITKFCGNLSWKDSIDTLGMELNVDAVRNIDDKYMKGYDLIEVGDKIILLNNNKELFRGIIVDLGINRYSKSITAFDYAFYLNQSMTIIQFNKVNADEAIKQLCSKFNVPTGNIVPISTAITKIYKDNIIAEIIRDILEQATNEWGTNYRLEMREGKLYIEKYTDLIITPRFKPASNVASLNPLKTIGSISKSESIADMRNSILISSNDEKSSRVIATAKDEKSISKFGLLQEIESVDDKDMAKAKLIAQNKLKELNKIKEDISIKLLGDDNVRAGRILEVDNDTFKLKGQYLIKDCTHTYQNRIHTMDLTLERVI